MKTQLEKPWRPLVAEEVSRLGGELGVYHIADETGQVVKIGYAGGRSLKGLKGVLQQELSEREGTPSQFRVEVTHQYLSRYEELLMLHQADHGSLPPQNQGDRNRRLGHLSPA